MSGCNAVMEVGGRMKEDGNDVSVSLFPGGEGVECVKSTDDEME